MKKVLNIIIFIFISSLVYAVDLSYIPANSTLVASAKIDTLSEKIGVNTQTLLNDLFLKDLSEKYLALRKNKRVSDAMENVSTILDFSKTARFTSAFNVFYSVMLDIKDIKQLDKIMLLMARGEDTVIQVIEEEFFRYLELDENFAIAWNEDVFVLISKSRYIDFDYLDAEEARTELEKIGFIKSNLEYAKKIFGKKDTLKSDTLLSLEKENNDINFWINSSLTMQAMAGLYSFMFKYTGYDEIMQKVYKEYEDSSYTIAINFEKGLASAVINSYTPKFSFDSTKIKKTIDKKVYQFAPNDGFGFLSIGVNTDIIMMAVNYLIKDTELETYINETLASEGLGDIGGIEGLISLFGGDIFLSVWYDEDSTYTENIATILSISFKNQDAVKKITKYLFPNLEVDEKNENLYYDTDSNIAIFLKDNILYAGTKKAILTVSENSITVVDKQKETLIQDNMFTIYVDANYFTKVLTENNYLASDEAEILKNFNSLEITSNPVSKTQQKTYIKLNLNNTDYNSIKVFYDILKSLGVMNNLYY